MNNYRKYHEENYADTIGLLEYQVDTAWKGEKILVDEESVIKVHNGKRVVSLHPIPHEIFPISMSQKDQNLIIKNSSLEVLHDFNFYTNCTFKEEIFQLEKGMVIVEENPFVRQASYYKSLKWSNNCPEILSVKTLKYSSPKGLLPGDFIEVPCRTIKENMILPIHLRNRETQILFPEDIEFDSYRIQFKEDMVLYGINKVVYQNEEEIIEIMEGGHPMGYEFDTQTKKISLNGIDLNGEGIIKISYQVEDSSKNWEVLPELNSWEYPLELRDKIIPINIILPKNKNLDIGKIEGAFLDNLRELLENQGVSFHNICDAWDLRACMRKLIYIEPKDPMDEKWAYLPILAKKLAESFVIPGTEIEVELV